MSGPLRFYFDFTCPYAYLGSVVVGPRAAASGLEVVAEPVLLGGILRHYEVPQAPAQHMPAPKLLHGDQDIRRLASILEAPYERPPRHPQRSVEALRCVLALQDTGLDPWDFIHRTYRAYWAEGRDISSEDTLRA